MSVAELLKTDKKEVPAEAQRRPVYTPATDLYSNEEEHVLKINLPGVQDGNLEIYLEKDELRVSAKTSVAENNGELRYSEYRTGDYRRSFLLSEAVEEDKISAVLKNGVLEIRLPRKKPQTKKIDVKTN